MESTHAELATETREKEYALMEWLRRAAPIAIGFSGGVDSAYLAAAAVEAVGASNVVGFIGRSASYPESQWAVARSVAARVGLSVIELDTDELNDPRYAANPTNRCSTMAKAASHRRAGPMASFLTRRETLLRTRLATGA